VTFYPFWAKTPGKSFRFVIRPGTPGKRQPRPYLLFPARTRLTVYARKDVNTFIPVRSSRLMFSSRSDLPVDFIFPVLSSGHFFSSGGTSRWGKNSRLVLRSPSSYPIDERLREKLNAKKLCEGKKIWRTTTTWLIGCLLLAAAPVLTTTTRSTSSPPPRHHVRLI
jgi:hypothetical protein